VIRFQATISSAATPWTYGKTRDERKGLIVFRKLNIEEENTIKMSLRGGYQEDENALLGTIYFTIKVTIQTKS